MNADRDRPEYLTFRCCMCPNHGEKIDICPGIPHTLHPEASPCRFVKRYVDEYGVEFTVFRKLGGRAFRTHCIPPEDKTTVYEFGEINAAYTFDDAQAALNAYAKAHGWEEA